MTSITTQRLGFGAGLGSVVLFSFRGFAPSGKHSPGNLAKECRQHMQRHRCASEKKDSNTKLALFVCVCVCLCVSVCVCAREVLRSSCAFIRITD